MRRFIINSLIWFLERDLYNTPIKRTMDDERTLKMLGAMWNLPGFREYCIERETRFVHALAGDASNPEKQRDNQLKHGQRVESMILFNRARTAFDMLKKRLPKETPRASSGKR